MANGMHLLLMAALSVTFPAVTTGAKILLVPLTHFSHVNLFANQGKALMKQGHEVSMVAENFFGDKIKKEGIKPFLYSAPAFYEMEKQLEDLTPKLIAGEITFATIIHTVLEIKFEEIVRDLMQNEKLLKQLEAEKFDLAVVDGFVPYRFIYALPYRLSIPHVTLSAVADPWAAGVTAQPSAEPVQMQPHSDQMSFTERAYNTFITLIFKIRGYLLYNIKQKDDFVEKYMPGYPVISTDQMHRDSLFWFINIETHCLDYPRLEGPNYKFIGGSSIRDPKPLPKELKAFVEGAKHGVIAMSFGSVKGYASVPTIYKETFLGAFSQLKQRVIFQCESAKFDKLPPNVRCVDWLPQNDLLAHPKTVLFISHGGNNGQLEAIHYGVPILTMPLTTEQAYNGRRVVHHGYGLLIDIKTLTPEIIVKNIQEITTNSSYAENVKKCSSIIKEFPSPQETFVFWVNHILKYGGKHLRPSSADMPMYKLYNWDLSALVAFILFNIIHIFIYIVLFVCKKCRGSKPKTD